MSGEHDSSHIGNGIVFRYCDIFVQLSVIRALHVFSAWQPPDMPGDSAANVPTADRLEPSRQVCSDMHR
jgi:hypothetical protein